MPMNKMNKKIRKKWLQALRSEDYVQGQGYLCQEIEGIERFCCLGVLLDVADKRPWTEVDSFNEKTIWGVLDKEEGTSSTDLPIAFAEKVGLESGEEEILMEANDDRGLTFEEIADLIEERDM
jgi:hypothetical protein